MYGVVNLDKPVGPTSHDMVGLLRRLTSTRRVGHAGTLDPLASGVLPVLIGPATRFSDDLTGGSKRYEAVIRLGARSATDDAQGPIEPVEAPLPNDGDVTRSLAAMLGTSLQVPPAFSARKVGGRTAHRAARAGEPLQLAPREVTISRLDIRGMERGQGWIDVAVDISCGAGTYVRSIARDLGETLGTGGYLRALRRTESAGLSVADAHTPEGLEALSVAGRLDDAIIAIGPLLPHPVLRLEGDAAWRFVHGSTQHLHGEPEDGRRSVFEGPRLLGIGTVENTLLRPDKVLPPEVLAR